MKYEFLKSISKDFRSYQSFIEKEKRTIQKYSEDTSLINAVKNHHYIQTQYYNFHSDTITIGRSKEITKEQQEKIISIASLFIPWRKGPFDIFGIPIESEWKSHFKWNSIAPFIGSLNNKIVCDIGCNNGYYLFKIYSQKPKYVFGIDPIYKYYLNFQFLYNFIKIPNIFFYNVGFQELQYLNPVFDVVFCMGILYHHHSPIEILLSIKNILKQGGKLIIETMVIVDSRPIALFPGKTYGRSRGFWFIPSTSCLIEWLKKSGFHSITLHYNKSTESKEQSKTNWAPYFSFIEDGCFENKTKEGYPIPNRVCITCLK